MPGDQDGQPAHAVVTLPPLATVWFRRRRVSVPEALSSGTTSETVSETVSDAGPETGKHRA